MCAEDEVCIRVKSYTRSPSCRSTWRTFKFVEPGSEETKTKTWPVPVVILKVVRGTSIRSYSRHGFIDQSSQVQEDLHVIRAAQT